MGRGSSNFSTHDTPLNHVTSSCMNPIGSTNQTHHFSLSLQVFSLLALSPAPSAFFPRKSKSLRPPACLNLKPLPFQTHHPFAFSHCYLLSLYNLHSPIWLHPHQWNPHPPSQNPLQTQTKPQPPLTRKPSSHP